MSTRSAERIATKLLIIFLWILLGLPSLIWISHTLSAPWARLNLLMVVAVIFISFVQFQPNKLKSISISHLSHPINSVSLTVLGGCAVVYTAAYNYGLGNRIPFVIWAFGIWGLYGLFVDSPRWIRSIVVVSLLMLLLPLSEQLDVYIGFPLRVWTTQVVERLFVGLTQDITSQNMLQFEGRLTRIDLPCSGVRSLWSAAVLVLGLSWIRQARFGLKWFGISFAYLLLLIVTNIFRIIILVGVGLILGHVELADVIHLPLGLMGFAASSLFYVWAFDRLNLAAATDETKVELSQGSSRALVVAVILITGSAIGFKSKPSTAAQVNVISPTWSLDMPLEEIALTPVEQQFYAVNQAWLSKKHRFDVGEISGSVVWVGTDSWRSHHNPIRCYQSSGLKIVKEQTLQISEENFVRILSFEESSMKAVFWFQSESMSTDDFSARIWEDFMGRKSRWVMVSILFDSQYSDIVHIVRRFHQQADEILQQARNGTGD